MYPARVRDSHRLVCSLVFATAALGSGCGDDRRGAAPSDGSNGGPDAGSPPDAGMGPGTDGGDMPGPTSPFPSDPAGGEFAWVTSGTGAVGPVSVAVDGAGDIFVAATQTDELTVGDVHLPRPTGEALVVLKLTAAGKPVWAQSFRGFTQISAHAIAAAPSGDVVVGGESRDDALVRGAHALADAFGSDGFVLALDGSTGALRWIEPLISPADDRVVGITAGSDAGVGAIYAYGQLGAAASVDGHALPAGAFLLRFDLGGAVRWAQGFAGIDSGSGNALALDPQRGPVIAGRADGAVRFGGQILSGGALVAGFDPDGGLRFVRQILMRFNTFRGKLAVAPDGDVYLASQLAGTPTVVDDPLFIITPTIGEPDPRRDLFLLRMALGETHVFSRVITGDSSASAIDVITDAAGNSYLLGTCAGRVDVDPELHCDSGTGSGVAIASYGADNAPRWSTFLQPGSAAIAAAPGDRVILAGETVAGDVNFGGVHVATQRLFIAALGAGPARPPSPLPAAPAISKVALDGASDTEIRQGGTGTLVIDGVGLDRVTSARLGDRDIHVPASAVTANQLRLPVTVPHGQTPGPLSLTLRNAGGMAQAAAVIVTPIVVGPAASAGGRGTFSSPLSWCAVPYGYGDTVRVLDGTHTCDHGFVAATGLTIHGQSKGGTVIRTGILLDPELSPDPFGTTVIENLTMDGGGISVGHGHAIVSDVSVQRLSSSAFGIIGGKLVATNIDVDGSLRATGIEIIGDGFAAVDGYRYAGGGHGIAIDIPFGRLEARHVTIDAALGILLANGTLTLADSEISTEEVAVDAGNLNTNSGTRSATITNTTLRSTRVALTAAGGPLTVTGCTLERGPGVPGRTAEGIQLFGGTLALSHSVLRGFEFNGIATEPGVNLPDHASSLLLDDVQIDAGDTGISYWSSSQGRLRLRNSHIVGARTGIVLVSGGNDIDFGTEASPGGNQIDAAGGFALDDSDDGRVIGARGTRLNGMSFTGDVQGPASAAGAYRLRGTDLLRF